MRRILSHIGRPAEPPRIAPARTVYRTCCYTAFGATFGALAIVSLIPRDSLIEQEFRDDALVAEEAFNEHESAIVEPSLAIPAAA